MVPVSAALASAEIWPGAAAPPCTTSCLPWLAAAAGLQVGERKQHADNSPLLQRGLSTVQTHFNTHEIQCIAVQHQTLLPLRRYRVNKLGSVRLAISRRRRRRCRPCLSSRCRCTAGTACRLTRLEALKAAVLIPHLHSRVENSKKCRPPYIWPSQQPEMGGDGWCRSGLGGAPCQPRRPHLAGDLGLLRLLIQRHLLPMVAHKQVVRALERQQRQGLDGLALDGQLPCACADEGPGQRAAALQERSTA